MAKRLKWCKADIFGFLRPNPKHARVDNVLQHLGEDTAHEENELPYDEEAPAEEGAPASPSEASAWSEADEYEATDWTAAVAAPADGEATERGAPRPGRGQRRA